MRTTRLLPPALSAAAATLAAITIGGGCSPEARTSEGEVGSTQAGLVLNEPGFVETTAISGLKNPTVVRFAGDGRVFVAEKSGRILVFDDLADPTPTVFTNLANSVHDFWDRGLLGMTLDPAFPSKPYVYVLYAYDGDPDGAAPKWGDQCPNPPGATGDGCVISGRLSRFKAVGSVAESEQVLVQGWRQQYPSHATGQVEFGPDGALYASGGDGASFNFVDYGQDGTPRNPLGDPPVPVGGVQTPPTAQGGALRSQSPRRPNGPVLLNGSIIRVDPETGQGLPDNPLAASSDENARRIIAYGLRNPFRIATRPGQSELWIADVGWNLWEEVNRLPLGGSEPLNFGWPCYEGASKQAGYDGADLDSCETLYTAGGHAAPFFAYHHNNGVSANDDCGRGSSSVTGIAFYDGSSYPSEYQGAMFFADYSRRCIYVMSKAGEADPVPASARSFHVDASDPVFLTTGPGGDLFYAALNAGTIQRISYLQPVAAFTASPKQGQVPLIVSFDGSTSVKPLPEDTLTYAWDLDGDGEFDDSSDEKPASLYDVVGSYQVQLKVTDPRGISNISPKLTIKALAEPPPVSSPPVPIIDTPSAGLRWKAGEAVHFTGHATDAEDGVLPPSALSWQVVIQHCPDGCHVHDLLGFDGVSEGSFTAEDHEYPMYLELILTATDASGQKRSARRRIDPATVSLVFDTQPSGLELVVGATKQQTPFTRRVIHGSENTVSADLEQMAGGSVWKFDSWSDGLPRAHSLPTAEAAARYVAKYTPGGGLTAQYFDTMSFGGTPLLRLDPSVDFNWGLESPDATIGPDTFSARWTGEVLADFAETYTFSTLSDDGVRLWIDGAAVIDNFTSHAPTVDTGNVALSPGWHDLVLEYFENGGGAQLSLSWSSPSQASQVVPESHLRPGCAGGACAGTLTCNAQQQCVPLCDPAQCAATHHCRLDQAGCVTACDGVPCPAGDKCSDGLCVDLCVNVTCDQGKHCELGECVDDPPPVGGGGAGGEAGAGGAPTTPGGEAGAGGSPSIPGGEGGAAGAASGGDGGTAGAAGTAGQPGGGSAAGDAGGPSGTGGEALAGAPGAAGAPDAVAGAAAQAGQPSAAGAMADGGRATGTEGGAPPTEQPASGEGGEHASSGGRGGDSGGCGCRTAPAQSSRSGLGLAALALAAALRRRRRARS